MANGDESEVLGKILRGISDLGTNQSALHVKVDSLHVSVKRQADARMQDRFDIERAHRRIHALEHQAALAASASPNVPDWHPDPREITGTHSFAVVKAEHDALLASHREEEARKRDSSVWWRRQTRVWIVAAIGFLAAGAMGGCGTYLLTRFTK